MVSDNIKVEIAKLVLLKLVQLGVGVAEPFFISQKERRMFGIIPSKAAQKLGLAENQIRDTIYKLKRQGVLSIKRLKNGDTEIKLTDKGRTRVLKYNIDNITIKRPEVWDGKWRIVIFDVPDKERKMRDYFRRKIQSLGFVQLQRSVYVHPFVDGDSLEFLRSNYNIKPSVIVIAADRIEGEEKLYKNFGIKRP